MKDFIDEDERLSVLIILIGLGFLFVYMLFNPNLFLSPSIYDAFHKGFSDVVDYYVSVSFVLILLLGIFICFKTAINVYNKKRL